MNMVVLYAYKSFGGKSNLKKGETNQKHKKASAVEVAG